MALDSPLTQSTDSNTTNTNTNPTNGGVLNEEKKSEKRETLDPERGANGAFASKYGNSDSAVGGRIGPVLGHLAGYDFGSDDSGSDILGKQLEMEAGDAIQYRTCSWQKVSFQLFSMRVWENSNNYQDCSFTLLRVHLSSYHVLPIQLFSTWAVSRSSLDRGGCRSRPIHFAYCLVSCVPDIIVVIANKP